MYDKLVEIGKRALHETDVHTVLTTALDGAIESTGAERGLIILFGEADEILFEAARNLRGRDIASPKSEISRTIVNKVKADSKAICLRNAMEHSRFERSASSVRLRILSVICLPLCYDEACFGVLYLDNRTLSGVFQHEICDFAASFADFISLAAHHALEEQRLRGRQHALEEELRSRYDFESIVGNSPSMLAVLELVSKVADTEVPVLIEGESGTGKELVARAIHFNSRRRQGPLVSVNCAALPETLLESEFFGHEKGAFTGAFKRHKGKFEQADGGTIFLDEVDEMSPALQVKLLRILQWGEFSPLGSDHSRRCDVRIVAASKQPVAALVQRGRFRDDLYYRLNLIRIEMPPLRQRREDVLLLANSFLRDACTKLSKDVPAFGSDVQLSLQQYDYPGNVRELDNVVRRAAILCNEGTIGMEHLPVELHHFRSGGDGNGTKALDSFQEAKKRAIEEFERTYLQRLLRECDGVIRRAAKHAGMHEKNLHVKLARYGIRPGSGR